MSDTKRNDTELTAMQAWAAKVDAGKARQHKADGVPVRDSGSETGHSHSEQMPSTIGQAIRSGLIHN